MLSDIADKQVQLDEEYKLSSEQILLENQLIFKSLAEIKRKLTDFDARLTNLEQQQNHIMFTSSQQDSSDFHSEETNTLDTALEKPIQKEKQHSTCFSCRWENKHCTLYFDDLYDFDKKEINTNIGADLDRFRCRCGHLIRIHELHTNLSQTQLPSFANSPWRQLLYEELVPPVIQNWIWSYQTIKSKKMAQSNKENKQD